MHVLKVFTQKKPKIKQNTCTLQHEQQQNKKSYLLLYLLNAAIEIACKINIEMIFLKLCHEHPFNYAKNFNNL